MLVLVARIRICHLIEVEVVVYKEISVTPFVLLEHFECEGNKLAVTAEVVENLGVGLC